MIYDTRADERVAVSVEIDSPGIAGAVGEHFKFPGKGMIPGNGGGYFDAGSRSLGDFDFRMCENAVSEVKATVGAPGKTIQQFVPIIQAEAAQENGAGVSDIVVVCVLQEQ